MREERALSFLKVWEQGKQSDNPATDPQTISLITLLNNKG